MIPRGDGKAERSNMAHTQDQKLRWGQGRTGRQKEGQRRGPSQRNREGQRRRGQNQRQMTARARGDGKGRARVKKRGHSEELGAGQKCPWAAHDPLGSSTVPKS